RRPWKPAVRLVHHHLRWRTDRGCGEGEGDGRDHQRVDFPTGRCRMRSRSPRHGHAEERQQFAENEGPMIRSTPLVSAAFILGMLTPVAAQDWDEFISPEERFSCNFPGKPAVTETTWTSQFGAVLPARIYSGTQGSGKYSITVVDYNPIERLLSERSMSCTPGAETCQGIHDWGLGYWKNDVRGAVVFAANKFLQRDVKVVNVMANFADLVSGQELQLTDNKDQSRIFASIYMHDNRLIILEASVPKNYPPPTIFQQSLSWLDEKGTRIRYNNINYNDPDVAPPRIRGR